MNGLCRRSPGGRAPLSHPLLQLLRKRPQVRTILALVSVPSPTTIRVDRGTLKASVAYCDWVTHRFADRAVVGWIDPIGLE